MLAAFAVFDKTFYVSLAVVGVPANFLAMVILSRGKCGLSSSTTRYLMAMATADLLVIITEVILYQIKYHYFPVSFLDITPVCSFNAVLRTTAKSCSVWLTVTFPFDQFVAICCQKLRAKYCTGKTAVVVLATTDILLCLINSPFYFTQEPGVIIDSVPWGCITNPSYFTDIGWMGFKWFHTIFNPFLPFFSILLFNALTVSHILVASQVRKRLRGQSKGESQSDPEMEGRRKSIILLFTISGSFILLWLVNVVEFLHSNITGAAHNNLHYVVRQVGFMLASLSCCTNTFIYGVTQSKFREQVKKTMKYPLTSIIRLMKKKQ